MRFVGHHLAHALSAYAYSGFDDAAVVVMDGRGAWEATSIWHGRDGRIERVLTIPFPDSVGYFYSEFMEYLGFQRNSDEWKVMGLAPYGKPGVDLHAFIEPEAAPHRQIREAHGRASHHEHVVQSSRRGNCVHADRRHSHFF
jgi:predicted NodU family carbamoyl transferase